MDDFVGRSRLALSIASDRVKAKYGFPCARALKQLQDIEAMATQYQQHLDPKVVFVNYSDLR